jgi:hypothetical protein
MKLAVCCNCATDHLLEQMSVKLSPEQKAEARNHMKRHLEWQEIEAKKRIRWKDAAAKAAKIEHSERSLREAKDQLAWAAFHLDRAGYPETILNALGRLVAMIEAKQSIEFIKHRKGINTA